jgi:hypothetical protein
MPNPPIILPIAEWQPDLPDYPAQGSAVVQNVVPLTDVSYGAIKTPTPYSGALNARCQGSAAFVDSSLAVTLVAGDATKLYRLVSGSNSWADVTRLSGPYTLGSDGNWEFEYFNGSCIATNYTDAVQTFNLISDANFSDLAAGAPKARTIGVIKNAFVMLGNTVDGSNGAKDQRIWWSGAGDATSWPTPGGTTAAQVQSGAADLLGDEGAVMAIRSGIANCDGIVFQRYGVRTVTYAGPPEVFSILPAQGLRGTPASQSPTVFGGIVYFLADDGFYAFDGTNAKGIGTNKIDRTFFNDLDIGNVHRVIGVTDPVNKLIIWAYPGQQSVGGNPNRLLIYHTEYDKFSLAEITCETISRMLGLGYTLDQLFTVLGYTLNTLPASLDSPIWQGGALQFGLFDANHKLNYLTGDNMAAQVDTSEMQPFPGRRAFVKAARPLVDGGTPSVSIGHRERVQDAVVNTSAVALNGLGFCGVRTSGRYFRASTTTVLGDTWTHIAGVELDAVQQGLR